MPQVYQVLEGDTYRNLMPKLREAGLVPMTVADLMRARLESVKSRGPNQKGVRLDCYLHTPDGIATWDKDEIKIVLDAPALKDIESYADLSTGNLILTREDYKALDGEEFSRKDLKKAGINTRLSESKVKSHPIWQALARDDYLLEEYVNAIFAEVKHYSNKNIAMGVYLDFNQEISTIQPWFALSIRYGSSSIRGYGDFHDRTRLVGRAKDVAQKGTLETVVK